MFTGLTDDVWFGQPIILSDDDDKRLGQPIILSDDDDKTTRPLPRLLD